MSAMMMSDKELEKIADLLTKQSSGGLNHQ